MKLLQVEGLTHLANVQTLQLLRQINGSVLRLSLSAIIVFICAYLYLIPNSITVRINY